MTDPSDTPVRRATRSLDDAVTLVKHRDADRSDTVVDMADAERARLNLLREELEALANDLQKRGDIAERFDFAVSQGARPRLWIDVVAWVQMGNDRRTYRFLRETAAGRGLIAESGDIDLIAEQVATYVAERIVERERRIDTEIDLRPAAPVAAKPAGPAPRKRGFWRALLGFLASFIIGAIIVAGAAFALIYLFPDLIP